MKITLFSALLIGAAQAALADQRNPIIVYSGYITQVHCKGKLLLSSVGDSKLITRQAFPKELRCGVLIQAEALTGKSDLLLKTTVGDFHRILEIRKTEAPITPAQLEVFLEPDSQEVQK